MKERRQLMGMPVTVEIVDSTAEEADLEAVFNYFQEVDDRFSTYKENSEISQINAGTLTEKKWSTDMQYVLAECEKTRQETDGYFDIHRDGKLDPSGYVKGWAIQNAADHLSEKGFHNYYLEIGGDLQVAGQTSAHTPWTIGIRNPFGRLEIVKRVQLSNHGMATSGSYLRGEHIYNPHDAEKPLTELVSLTVIGPRIVDADRYATAAFAMGNKGVQYISGLPHFEAYAIHTNGIATFTNGFKQYVV